MPPTEEHDAQTPETPGPEAEPAGDPDAAAEQEPEAPAEPPVPLDIYSMLRISIAQLAGVAWQKLGLQPDPFTNQVYKDLDQARLAIDATAALIEKLQPHLQGQDARDLQTILTDLRLNFVKQSGESSDTS